MSSRPRTRKLVAHGRGLADRLAMRAAAPRTARPVALPALKPTYGPFSDRELAEVEKRRLTREHLGYLNSQRGFLAVEQTRDGQHWVVRHLGKPQPSDRIARWLGRIPPLP